MFCKQKWEEKRIVYEQNIEVNQKEIFEYICFFHIDKINLKKNCKILDGSHEIILSNLGNRKHECVKQMSIW